MTIFPLAISRFSQLIAHWLRRLKRHQAEARLEGLSDRSLLDIGLEPSRRDYDAVKPFWMP
jgi:uncharacterized protein YjiS (DUF1127 family)